MEYILHHKNNIVISSVGDKEHIKISFLNPHALLVNYHPKEGNFFGRQQVNVEISKEAMIEAAKGFLVWAESDK